MAKVSERVLKEAWIGDAVLALWARERILREGGATNGALAERMTSNQFLSGVGEPSHVEAVIGRAYEAGGLAAAYAWIEANLLPLYERQEAKRARGRRLPHA